VDEINKGNWDKASELLEEIEVTDDYTAILKASVYEHYEKYDEMFQSIRTGLLYNGFNYELYVMLGNYYLVSNLNQAYLCYENALFYCDNEADKAGIEECMNSIRTEVSVRPFSVVIVSYNNQQIMQDCIESIRKYNPSTSYELIVVDNASSDGVCEWLKEQEDIILIQNKDNKGFGFGCNQGVKASAPDNDIFFLNNDTVVMPNAIFWLRMGLYDNDRNGATSCMSNDAANEQTILDKFDTIDEYYTYALKNNIPEINACEIKIWLVGFAVLISRPVLDVTGLFDLRYGNGYYEDDDLGIRIQLAGYRNILCRNSFIFHYGSKSFGRENGIKRCIHNRGVFKQKWGFDIELYTHARGEIIGLIDEDRESFIHVLEVGCGCGATLERIKYIYPNAVVSGIESNGLLARIGSSSMDIIHGNIETAELSYEKEYFDYIIFTDVLEHLYNPEIVLQKMKAYLKQGGRILCSIPNILHASVMLPLLNGEFRQQDNIRCFTLQSIYQMMAQSGYRIETVGAIRGAEGIITKNSDLVAGLQKLMAPNVADMLYAYKFIVKARLG
jgi:GT2 family glycosyltransferase